MTPSPKALWTEGARRAVVPAAEWFANGRVTPNRLTVAGLVLNVATAPLIVTGHFLWALAVYLAASICDLLDGAVARVAQQVTAFGALVSTFNVAPAMESVSRLPWASLAKLSAPSVTPW